MNFRGFCGANELEVWCAKSWRLRASHTTQPQKHQHLQPPLSHRTENTS